MQVVELDDKKSTQGLGELYEQDYLKAVTGVSEDKVREGLLVFEEEWFGAKDGGGQGEAGRVGCGGKVVGGQSLGDSGTSRATSRQRRAGEGKVSGCSKSCSRYPVALSVVFQPFSFPPSPTAPLACPLPSLCQIDDCLMPSLPPQLSPTHPPAVTPTTPHLSLQDEEVRQSARAQFAALCAKLDALSHLHFRPKPVIDEVTVKVGCLCCSCAFCLLGLCCPVAT